MVKAAEQLKEYKAPWSTTNRCDLYFANPAAAHQFLHGFRGLPEAEKRDTGIELRLMADKNQSASIKDGRCWEAQKLLNSLVPG